jgi:Fe-S cluster biogenesis protein NfuA
MKEELSTILERFKEERGVSALYLVDQKQADGKSKIFIGVRPSDVDSEIRSALQEEIMNAVESRKNEINDDLVEVNTEIQFFSEPFQEVKHLLDANVAAYAEADGGEIKIKEIDEIEGLVVLSLNGACAGCPASVLTLKAGIRRILEKSLPWFRKVVPTEDPKEPDFGFKLR